GAATITVTASTLGVGTTTVTATYNGSTLFSSSSGSVSEQVLAKYATTTVIASSLNPAVSGQSVTFTATVTSGNGIPGGNVTFARVDNSTGAVIGLLGTRSLSSAGAATITVTASTLGVGTTTVTATYNGSTLFSSSS